MPPCAGALAVLVEVVAETVVVTKSVTVRVTAAIFEALEGYRKADANGTADRRDPAS